MKNLIFSFVFVSISFIANGQYNNEVKAILAGYGARDTIMLDDFLKLSELSLSKKDYSIISFELSFIEFGGYTKTLVSNSNKITDEMKNSLVNKGDQNTDIFRITIEDIKAKTPQNKEVLIEPLVHKFKLR